MHPTTYTRRYTFHNLYLYKIIIMNCAVSICLISLNLKSMNSVLSCFILQMIEGLWLNNLPKFIQLVKQQIDCLHNLRTVPICPSRHRVGVGVGGTRQNHLYGFISTALSNVVLPPPCTPVKSR